MLRVTFLTVMPSPYVQDLFRALDADDRVELSVWYLEQEAPDTLWGEQTMPSYARVLPGRWHGVSGARIHRNPTIRSELKDSDADLFVIVGYIGLTNQIAMRTLTKQNRPWCFWGEIPGFRKRGMIGDWIRRRLQAPLRGCSGFAAVGSHALAAYQKLAAAVGARTEIFANIPYHCDLDNFQNEATQRLPSETVRFLYCGQLIERKGVDLLLNAFETLIQSGANASLSLAGDGPLRDSLQANLSDQAAQQVNFLGFQKVEDLPRVFADADVFLLPSRHDGWGVVVNQAVGSGMPVIATEAVGAANDLVSDGVNGFRVEADSETALHAAMNHFCQHPADIQSFGKKNEELASTISLNQAVEDWVSFFSKAIASADAHDSRS